MNVLNGLKSELEVMMIPLNCKLPKIIWMYWAQGIFDESPEVVRLSVESWRKFNTDYEVRVVTDKNVEQYCPIYKELNKCSVSLRQANKSDFLRTYLLVTYGGVWVDATTFCYKPLDFWFNDSSLINGLFFFFQPENVVDRQVKLWFMVSIKGHPILARILRNLIEYLFKERECNLNILPLHLNNKMFKKYSNLVGRSNTGYGFLEVLEQEGLFPFFCYFYILNETVKETSEIRKMWKEIESNPLSKIDHILLVSKQSHQPRWMENNRNLYNARSQKLKVAMLEHR